MHELLESRVLFSGTVNLQIAHDRFFITGDNQANQIVISENNNIVSVAGLSGTKIVGTHKNLNALPRGIVVTLSGGNDAVTFSGHVQGDFDIEAGDGDDTIIVRNASVSNSMLLQGGAGDNNITITNSAIRFNTEIDQDAGTDLTAMTSVHVGNQLKINDPFGSAQMSLSKLIVDGDTTIKTGDAADGIALHHSILNGDTTIATAGGNDSIFLSDTHTNGSVKIDPGAGANHVQREVFINSDFSQGLEGWVGEAAGISAVADANVEVDVHSVHKETNFQPRVLEMSSETPATLYLKRTLTSDDGIIAGQSYNVTFTVNYLSDRPASATADQVLKVGAVGHIIRRSINPDSGLYQTNIDHGSAQNGGADTTIVGDVNNNTGHTTGWKTVSMKRTLTQTVQADSKGRLSLFVGTDPLGTAGTDMRYIAVSVKLTPAKPFANLV